MNTIRDSIEAGKAAIRSQNEDSRRGEFLRALDVAAETLSDFEINFVGGFIKDRGAHPIEFDFRWFTPGRRQVVDNMIHRYGVRTLKAESGSQAKLPIAPAGACGYLVRNSEDNRREVCGAPATTTSPRGLELCAVHTQIRAEELAHLRAAKNKLRP